MHQLPQVSGEGLGLAQTEVNAAGGAPSRHAVSDEEVKEIVASALQRIRPSALEVCREMNVGGCDWQFRLSSDRTLNAHAEPGGLIVINRGIVEYADNEDQVAMVIAHEIGHQMAKHIETAMRNQATGALVGAVLLGALGAVASRGSSSSPYVTSRAASAGAQAGGAIGRISFSKEQEREADYLAALILYRAGLDLDKARGFLVTMARGSGRRETGMLDTHPAGPERLAAWDRAVAEIRASNGQLPKRA
ncbi:MAG: M48 family metallopeptidase [Reyranellaceae bacterium]